MKNSEDISEKHDVDSGFGTTQYEIDVEVVAITAGGVTAMQVEEL